VRRSFADRLPERLDAARRARGELAGSGLGDEGRAALFKAAHNIAGTAASLGGERLGRVAALVARSVDERRDPGELDAGELGPLLEEFEAAALEFLGWMEASAEVDGDP
jgi:HPt (histidine-containing phosphotransfer) domain-containing protein